MASCLTYSDLKNRKISFTKAFGSKDLNMAKAIKLNLICSTQAISYKDFKQATAKLKRKALFTKDKLSKVSNKEKAKKLSKMEINTVVNSSKTCSMDWENTSGRVELIFMAILSKVSGKEKAFGYPN